MYVRSLFTVWYFIVVVCSLLFVCCGVVLVRLWLFVCGCSLVVGSFVVGSFVVGSFIVGSFVVGSFAVVLLFGCLFSLCYLLFVRLFVVVYMW
jgi:hypothetical protein